MFLQDEPCRPVRSSMTRLLAGNLSPRVKIKYGEAAWSYCATNGWINFAKALRLRTLTIFKSRLKMSTVLCLLLSSHINKIHWFHYIILYLNVFLCILWNPVLLHLKMCFNKFLCEAQSLSLANEMYFIDKIAPPEHFFCSAGNRFCIFLT